MPRAKLRRSSGVAAAARHALLLLLGAMVLYPLVWLVAESLKPQGEAFTNPVGLLAGRLSFENYVRGWIELAVPFGRFILNSLIVCLTAAAGTLLSCSITAYALAILRPAGSRWLLGIILITVMLPYNMILIPQYIMFRSAGWVGSYLPLVMPSFFATGSFYVFILMQFMRALPSELFDAARVDGCGYGAYFRRVVLPLSVPALVAVGLLNVLDTWNQFLAPLVYLNNVRTFTVPLGLQMYLDQVGTSDFTAMLAMAVVALVPVAGIFLAMQRYIVDAVTTAGIRG